MTFKLDEEFWDKISKSEWFKRAHENRTLGFEISIEDNYNHIQKQINEYLKDHKPIDSSELEKKGIEWQWNKLFFK